MNAAASRPARGRKLLSWAVFLSIVAVVIVLPFRRALFDDPIRSDADLEPAERIGHFESPENGYPSLRIVHEIALQHPRLQYRHLTDALLWPGASAESVLSEEHTAYFFRATAVALEHFHQAMHGSELTFPEDYESALSRSHPEFSSAVRIAGLWSLRSACLERWDESTAIATSLLELGVRFESQARSVDDFMDAQRSKSLAAELLYRRAVREPWSPAEANAICARLQSAEPSASAISNVSRHVYVELRDDLEFSKTTLFMDESTTRRSGWIVYKPNRTRNDLADRYRHFISSVVRGEAPERDHSEWTEPESWWATLVHGNVRGESVVNLNVWVAEGVRFATERVRLALRGVRLIIALRSYELENSKLPETLDALVPRYLASVPIDPFNGERFSYSRENGRVWSIGRDRDNSQGDLHYYPREGELWSSGVPTFLLHPEQGP